MKKSLFILFLLFVLAGCSYANDSSIVEQSETFEEESLETLNPYLYVFGDLDLERRINNLDYKVSSSWQYMRSDVSDKLVKKYDDWRVAICTDTNLMMIFGYYKDDSIKVTPKFKIKDDLNSIVENDLKGLAYSLVDYVTLDNYSYGYIFDVTENKVTKRILFLNSFGGRYEIYFTNNTDSLSSIELKFAYEYLKTMGYEPDIETENS